MRLFEIVAEKQDIQKAMDAERSRFDSFIKESEWRLKELNRLQDMACGGINIDYVQIAEKIIAVEGKPHAITNDTKNGKTIADEAIEDIALGCPHLKTKYFGNKRYEGFYQRCDCEYGYGPSHGYIVDEIALKGRGNILPTDEEKDACIYYLKNKLYERIEHV
jgi:hypothetical protein